MPDGSSFPTALSSKFTSIPQEIQVALHHSMGKERETISLYCYSIEVLS